VHGFISPADKVFLLKKGIPKSSDSARSHLGEKEPDAQRGFRCQMPELVFRLDFPFPCRPHKEEKLHLPAIGPNSRLSSQIQPYGQNLIGFVLDERREAVLARVRLTQLELLDGEGPRLNHLLARRGEFRKVISCLAEARDGWQEKKEKSRSANTEPKS